MELMVVRVVKQIMLLIGRIETFRHLLAMTQVGVIHTKIIIYYRVIFNINIAMV